MIFNQEVMDKLSWTSPFVVPQKARNKRLHCKRRLNFDDTSLHSKQRRVGDEMEFSESRLQDSSNHNARTTVPVTCNAICDIAKPTLEIGYLKNKEQDEAEMLAFQVVLNHCSSLLQPNAGSGSDHVSSDDREADIMVSKMKDTSVVGPSTPSPTMRKATMKNQKSKLEEVSELVANSAFVTRSLMKKVMSAIEPDDVQMESSCACNDDRVLKLGNERDSLRSKKQISLKTVGDGDANKVWKALMKKAIAESCDTVIEKDESISVEHESSLIFEGKVKSFISKVGTVQGKREYSPWKGSVLDSVIGALLTQRVSDNFSSSAFMSLGMIFPQAQNREDRECAAYGRHHRMLRNQRLKGNEVKLRAESKESFDQKTKKNLRKAQEVSRKMNLKPDWDSLRRQYGSVDVERTSDTVDYVDWKAVMRADVKEVSEAIILRGMNEKLADRIKGLLDRVMKDHEKLDLEWLRNVPPLKAKEFLLSIHGLGQKCVACIQLLTIRQPAFPVDVNVARVTVRLGWVPIPGNTSDERLMSGLEESSNLRDLINEYLWKQLSKLDNNTLYELHCQMITFGKVFCTMKKPSCAECPMRKECKSYADIDIEDSGGMARLITQKMLRKAKGEWLKSKLRKDQTHFSLGGVEAPKTPAKDESHQKPRSHIEKNTDVSSSIARNKKKRCTRTQHSVYELPDWHPILEEFDELVCEDPSPYLLITWESDPLVEITASRVRCGTTVPGTVMIPYRTVLRGNFPLNGTYFQNNEVFADHKTSRMPIDVRCKTLLQLKKKTLYCGSSLSEIVKGFSASEVKELFKEGYICTRGFDRENGASVTLERKLHMLLKPKNRKLKVAVKQ